MTLENISSAKFLSTFGIASESCLNNLCLSRDQRERLFDQFLETTDGPTREQIMLQLFTMTQQESAQMHFMLEYVKGLRRLGVQLYLHTHTPGFNQTLCLFMPCSSQPGRFQATQSLRGPNLRWWLLWEKSHARRWETFDRPWSKAWIQIGVMLPPIQEKQEGQGWTLHKGYTTNPCRLHNIWYSSPFLNLQHKVVPHRTWRSQRALPWRQHR